MMIKMINYDDDDEQPADKVTVGERPLGEKLADGFEVKLYYDDYDITWKLPGAIELHRLVLEDYDQLEKQKNEITSTIIDSTCAVDGATSISNNFKEVSQPPLSLFPRPRHCTLHFGEIRKLIIKQRCCS